MCVNDDRVGVYRTFCKLIVRRAYIVSRRVGKMIACANDSTSLGKFVVHECDIGEVRENCTYCSSRLGHVFVAKRMLETHLMVTSVLLSTPYSSVPPEVSKRLLFC
jgi:hypothetical protein